MKRIFFFFFINACLFHFAYGQSKHANVWVFGFNAAIDFNTNPPTPLVSYYSDLIEGGTSICDKNGNLIAYTRRSETTSRLAVYNKNIQMVKDGIVLKTSTSSNTHTLMLQHPNDTSIIYIFTAPDFFTSQSDGYNYNVYDIKLDSLILRHKSLFQNGAEKMSAVFHPNGKDILITMKQHGNNCYNTYVITKHGINSCPIISCAGVAQNEIADGQGFLKYSSDGQYIANAFIREEFKIEIFKKDPIKHSLKAYRTIALNYSNRPYGLEYSPNGKYLYYTTSSEDSSRLVQHNLQTGKNITVYKDYVREQIFGIQIGPDHRIYIANNDSTFLGVINNPNEEGSNCNLNIKGFSLNGRYSLYGMPSFNQSYFHHPSINYSFEMNCTKNSVQFWGKDTFGANTHTWQVRKSFGVNSYSLIGSSKNINYTFADTGTYEVRYIASNGNKADTVVKSIVLYDKIKQGFLGKDTAYTQGDIINKSLFAPTPNHCVNWQDSSSLNSYTVNTKGTYICKVTNQAFCEVWDTVVISECINNLNQPSLFRSRDTLRTFHLNADSFVWYRNNQVYLISKEPFLALTDTGTYRVEAAKKGHCNSGSIGTNYVQRLNIKGIRIEELGISVFPNPSNGVVRIESNNRFKFEVYDISGRIIEKGENKNELTLPKGIYFLRLDVGGYKVTEKLIVF